MAWLDELQKNGTELELGRRGQAPGRTSLLLIHGAGGSAQSFLPQLSGIREVNLAAVSLPGHGGTPGPGRDTVDGYADWLLERLRPAGEPLVLLGHSMGGAIALEMALKAPELVKGLVLASTGARLKVLPAILEGIKTDFSPTVEMIIRFAYAKGANPQWLAMGAQEMAAVGPEVLHGDFTACDLFNASGRLGDIAQPTLCIYGQEDKLTPPKYGEFLRGAIPGAGLELIAGAGHMVNLEQAPEFNRLVSAFCAKL